MPIMTFREFQFVSHIESYNKQPQNEQRQPPNGLNDPYKCKIGLKGKKISVQIRKILEAYFASEYAIFQIPLHQSLAMSRYSQKGHNLIGKFGDMCLLKLHASQGGMKSMLPRVFDSNKTHLPRCYYDSDLIEGVFFEIFWTKILNYRTYLPFIFKIDKNGSLDFKSIKRPSLDPSPCLQMMKNPQFSHPFPIKAHIYCILFADQINKFFLHIWMYQTKQGTQLFSPTLTLIPENRLNRSQSIHQSVNINY